MEEFVAGKRFSEFVQPCSVFQTACQCGINVFQQEIVKIGQTYRYGISLKMLFPSCADFAYFFTRLHGRHIGGKHGVQGIGLCFGRRRRLVVEEIFEFRKHREPLKQAV